MGKNDIEVHQDDELDDDGRPRRTGTLWTSSAHVVTAIIGSGVLSLAWATAQLGWIGGPASLVVFSAITFYTSCLLADCYRTGDPVTGKRNHTYMEAVKNNLGGTQYWLCGICQYVNLFGMTIGYIITASICAAAVVKAHCFHNKGHEADCSVSYSLYMIAFGIIQIFLSQLPNFHKLEFLSIVAAVMSITYSLIAVVLPAIEMVTGDTYLIGKKIDVTTSSSEKVWTTFQALGNIAFAYTFSQVSIEIQDTLKSHPAENKVMKKATIIGLSTTTMFYILCGCLGFAAFGKHAPGNILTGFGFYEPYWLVDIGNISVVVHLVGAFQVFAQPLFAAIEAWMITRYPCLNKLDHEYPLITANCFQYNINILRLIWRTGFVILTTLLAILMPFFNAILAFLGAVGFCPLTVYFPVAMYIRRKNITRFSTKWMFLHSISLFCIIVSLLATCSAIQGVIEALHHYKPFQTKS